jgi:predicted lipoprotein with Yx(FWY)xxD motif
MNKLITAAAVLAGSLGLAACGGSSDSSGTTTSSGTGTTVAVKSIPGVGNVLVDSAGRALYSANVEANGVVHCTGACTSFWQPLTIASGTPTAAGDAGKLTIIKRPDGTRQVALGGKPLYTFSQDAPGKVAGNGFTDNFGGMHFTWTAVLAGGKSSSATTTTTTPRNDYGY